jgi:hypothetical protein
MDACRLNESMEDITAMILNEWKRVNKGFDVCLDGKVRRCCLTLFGWNVRLFVVLGYCVCARALAFLQSWPSVTHTLS